MLHKSKTILVIDIEFAKTYKEELNKSAVIEIGMILVSDIGLPSEKELTYTKLFNPGIKVKDYATRVTGITNKMIKGLSPISDSYDEIQDIIDRADVIVLHGGGHDLDALKNNGFELGVAKIVDTVNLARCSPIEFSDYQLKTLARELNVETDNKHRALDDVLATLAIYRKLTKGWHKQKR